ALFSVFTFMVLLGTLYPLLAEALQDRRISVGEPYFDRWALPLGIGIVFMMGVGPALPWGRLAAGDAPRRLGPPVIAGLVVAGVSRVGGPGPGRGPRSLRAVHPPLAVPNGLRAAVLPRGLPHPHARAHAGAKRVAADRREAGLPAGKAALRRPRGALRGAARR